MDTDYILHRVIRQIASWAAHSFFTEVRVIGGENVPANGPIIVYVSLLTMSGVSSQLLIARCRTATHHNMMLDPAILCLCPRFFSLVTRVDVTLASAFPHQRILHYWSKGQILRFPRVLC
jgi:hypothetical protein